MPNTSGSSYGITHNGSNGGARFTLTNTTIDPGQNGAVGIYISGSTVVFSVEVLEALKTNKNLTVKLEGNVLNLYDEENNLILQIPM